MYYIYMIRCSDGTHYTGIARYLCRRMQEHVLHLPQCAKYTRTRQVTALDALWKTEQRADAARLEALIKTLTKPQKLALIADPERLDTFFAAKLQPDRYEPVRGVSLEQCVRGEFHGDEP